MQRKLKEEEKSREEARLQERRAAKENVREKKELYENLAASLGKTPYSLLRLCQR